MTVKFEVEGHTLVTDNALVRVSSVVSSLCSGRDVVGFKTVRDVVDRIQTYSYHALVVVWAYANSGRVRTNAVRPHVVRQKHPSSFDEIFITECASLAHVLDIPRLVNILRLEMNREFPHLVYSEAFLRTLTTYKPELALHTYTLSYQSLDTVDQTGILQTISSAAAKSPGYHAILTTFFNAGDDEQRHMKRAKYRDCEFMRFDMLQIGLQYAVFLITNPQDLQVSCRVNMPTDRASHLYEHNTDTNFQQEIPDLGITAATMAGQRNAAEGHDNDTQPNDAVADDHQASSAAPSGLNLAAIARAALDRVNGVSKVIAAPVMPAYNTRSHAHSHFPSGQVAIPTAPPAPPKPAKKRDKKVDAGTGPDDTEEVAVPAKKKRKGAQGQKATATQKIGA